MQDLKFESVKHFGVSRESYEKLIVLEKLIVTWQSHINLIAPSTIPHIWERHIIDSLQLLPLIPAHTKAIADLGSGGGFPGLVLAACHDAKLHFFEANAKKTAFLQEALRHMKVSGVVHRQRLEPMVPPPQMPEVQMVTARAFAPLPLLLSLAEPFMRSGAVGLFHKGQESDAELTEAAKSWKISVRKHRSLTDSNSVILEIKEIAHV